VKFSLRTLIAVTSLAGLACAALAKPGEDWLTVVVSLTALAFAIQLLRVSVQRGAARAAAAGWLLFAASYLALVLAPWTREQIGPALVSSQALQAAQTRWFPESAGNQMAQAYVDLTNSLAFAPGRPYTITVSGNTSYALLQSLFDQNVASGPTTAGYFHLTGHWLFAWLAGWLGATVAAVCYHRGRRARAVG
jgi:hypothetical protein